MSGELVFMWLSTPDFDYVRGIVRQHSAIALDESKTYLAETRLVALAQREGIPTVSELVARLRVDRGDVLRRKVVEAMTTNETSFFRDLHPFEILQKVLIPELIQRRARQRSLNIWSAACSTGQEPYSLAMLLRSHFPELDTWQIRILASDLSTDVLARARSGRYTQLEVNRGVPAHLLVRHFKRQGLDWYVSDEIRRMIEFQVVNLIGTWPAMLPMDMILLRNVLIYFDSESKSQVFNRIAGSLAPDGYLILGSSETTFFNNDSFERVNLERSCIYRLKGPSPYGGPHLRNWSNPQ